MMLESKDVNVTVPTTIMTVNASGGGHATRAGDAAAHSDAKENEIDGAVAQTTLLARTTAESAPVATA